MFSCTEDTLRADLLNMDLSGNETLLIHSSMKKIGPVCGGAETVLDVLCDFFMQEGLLILPAFSYNSVLNCPGRNIFDVKNTPACTGILSELFRQRENVKRSLHPTHSLAAWGHDAASFIAPHGLFSTAFDRSGPFGKLLDRHGTVLLAGVTLTSATFLHAVEEWACVPVLSRKALDLYVRDEAGTVKHCPVHWHKGAHSEMYDLALEMLLEHRAVKPCQFGHAPSLLLDCCKTWEVLSEVLQLHPDLFFNKDCPLQAD